MSLHAAVNAYLRHFANFIGSPPLALNAQGVCAFTYQEKWAVAVELPESSTQLYLHAPVIEVAHESKLDIYELALILNAYCLKTRGSTLALDPDMQRILLCYTLPVEILNEVIFNNVLHNFVKTLQELREQFKSLLAAEKNMPAVSSGFQYWDQRV